MTTANTVYSGPASNVAPIKRSAKIASGNTIFPGMLVELTAGGEWQLHGTADQGGDFYIADMNTIEHKSATEALTIGDTASAFVPQVGCTYNLVLATSQTITVGELLTTASAGLVKSAAVDGTDSTLFVAEEAITTTSATARIRARYNPGTISVDTDGA